MHFLILQVNPAILNLIEFLKLKNEINYQVTIPCNSIDKL